MTIQAQINDHFAKSDDQARVEAAVAAHQAKTGLSDAEIVEAHRDTNSAHFDAIDSLVNAAATEGWADGEYITGEIVLSVA